MLARTRNSAHASRLQSAATRRPLSLGSAPQCAMIAIAPSGGPHIDPRISATAAGTVAAKIAQSIKVFWGDTDGVILPYVTLMLVVIIGVSVLALDGSRYMSLQTQLQNGADALALAGAAELDRTPTAIERATRAINRCWGADPIGTCGSRVSISCAPCRHVTATRFCRAVGRAIRRRLRSSRSRSSRSRCEQFCRRQSSGARMS